MQDRPRHRHREPRRGQAADPRSPAPAADAFQKALWFGLGYTLLLSWGLCDWCALAVAPFLLALLVHVRRSGRRLNAVVMASVLSVAERQGLSVVGEPEAF